LFACGAGRWRAALDFSDNLCSLFPIHKYPLSLFGPIPIARRLSTT